MIEPKILKGFKDSLPDEEIIRKKFIRKIEDSLLSIGYLPIDTPALEYFEILSGKSGEESEKQIFSFEDAGGRKVGLRFDLTVPLARFVALHLNELAFPFKRFHIAKVWRGEKPQKGRYREFYQADFDIIGSDTIGSDIEILNTIINLMESLNISNYKIFINDRKLLSEIFKRLNLQEYEISIMRIFDKIKKITKEELKGELIKLNLNESTIDKLFNILKLYDNHKEFFQFIKKDFNIENTRLEEIMEIFDSSGKISNIKIDLSITRGLDYYTGVVFETYIDDAINFGSVCSGGRYENLVSLFSKNVYSGIGGSIGLDRLIAILEEKGKLEKNSFNNILIINFSNKYLPLYFDLQKKIIENNIICEIFPDSDKIAKQFKYADKKGIRFTLIIGEDEIKNKKIKLKDLKDGTEHIFEDIEGIIEYVKNIKV